MSEPENIYPPDDYHYLTTQEVIDTHDEQIEISGGQPGILDPNLIDSAVNSPKQQWYSTIEEKAGILLFLLANNHGFADGNKRTGVYSMVIFLLINGYWFICSDKVAGRMVEYFVEGKFPKDIYIRWVKKHIVQVKIT